MGIIKKTKIIWNKLFQDNNESKQIERLTERIGRLRYCDYVGIIYMSFNSDTMTVICNKNLGNNEKIELIKNHNLEGKKKLDDLYSQFPSQRIMD